MLSSVHSVRLFATKVAIATAHCYPKYPLGGDGMPGLDSGSSLDRRQGRSVAAVAAFDCVLRSRYAVDHEILVEQVLAIEAVTSPATAAEDGRVK
jgi:hypothetical protein